MISSRLAVYRNEVLVEEVRYGLQPWFFSKPILVKEAEYESGDQFRIEVQYDWEMSPSPDFTLKIYSRQELEIRDAKGEMNVWHMDG
mmetsp:Transcript_14015/g.23812  ORF Transcript_14015/g.23812 Transcript_14015/m.23812 type:complete len:87 (+) Transcript_14015:1228-1488(+)